jgi:hypothetical protein
VVLSKLERLQRLQSEEMTSRVERLRRFAHLLHDDEFFGVRVLATLRVGDALTCAELGMKLDAEADRLAVLLSDLRIVGVVALQAQRFVLSERGATVLAYLEQQMGVPLR